MTLKSIQRIAIVVVLAAVASGGAMAATVPWTYVEAGYRNIDLDSALNNDSGDNWFLGGAFGGRMWHVIGEYSDGDASTSPTVEQTNWRIGFGWHGLLGESADLLAEAYYVNTELATVSNDGYRLVFGARWRPIKLFEVDGFVNYTDFGGLLGDDTTGEVRAIVHLWRIGLGLSAEVSSDVTTYNGFLRFNFGPN